MKQLWFRFLTTLPVSSNSLAELMHAAHDAIAARHPKRLSTSYGRTQMSQSKMLTFFVMVILGGMVQLWIAIIIHILKGMDINLAKILSDGSLFFFSTALVYASWFGLANETRHGAGDISFIVSWVSAGFVSLVSIALYGASASMNIDNHEQLFLPERYLMAQITTAVVAISYSFYASAAAGLFDQEQTSPTAPRGGVNG